MEMNTKQLQIEGYLYFRDEDVFLEKEKEEDDEYYYPNVDSIGEQIADHFKVLSKPVQVSFHDWTRGEFVAYKDVFCRYFISNDKVTWDEINEESIKINAGGLDTEKRYSGYSEYTITSSWTELFVGGHDLRRELHNEKNKGKYVIIRIDYKV